ncbi:MAG TPA: NAD-dependent epimerase/dehydratase family protein [Polyangiaceae bacterium]|nr:NAD-dependent epimerase/dehydratase family protein [Polyangiaceae bacterium]
MPNGLKFFVVGGSGFIGSHLVDRLVERGSVTIYDNLTIGKREFVAAPLASGRATLVQADALDFEALARAIAGHDVVFHLAANPEARWGLDNPRLDLEQGTIATHNVLEAARRTGVPRVVLASSGTVYGDTAALCREESLGRLPISLYGASKLAGEALVSAYVECFDLRAIIFRFGNVVGPRGTHGAALDFLKKLQKSPEELEVLGDGNQSKPYVHVTDCVDAILYGLDRVTTPLDVFNIAPPDATSVGRIAELCIQASPYPTARIRYTGGDRGWRGDVPHSRLDPSKLAALGWTTRKTSDEAVGAAIAALAVEVFGERASSS